MRAESVLFASSQPETYGRMARVLAASAAEHGMGLTIRRITSPDDDVKAVARKGCKRTWIDNARKAKWHCQIIQEARDGEVLCMIDADAMILGDLSEVEQMDFDIAYTSRPAEAKWKINTGVYFVRVSQLTKLFVRFWYCKVLDMLRDAKLHDRWRKEYRWGGVHQAAFGWMTENFAVGLKLLALPCAIYNCECSSIETADNPKVLHVMGRVRQWCLGTTPQNPSAARLVEKWKERDRSCKA